jgi:hypothetical protein
MTAKHGESFGHSAFGSHDPRRSSMRQYVNAVIRKRRAARIKPEHPA